MSFRRSFVRTLADYRWYLLGAAGILAFLLGYIGFSQFLGIRWWPPCHSDPVYRSLRLFLLEGGEGSHVHGTHVESTHVPLSLDIARFLAPVVAGGAGLSGLASLFRDRVQQMRIPLMRDHVVLCGLGYVGSVFLRHLREAGERVVVVESDAANPSIEMCRSLRVPVIVGDAQLPRTLQAAGIDRAARLLAVCPQDAVNAEIVAVAGHLARGRSRGALRCLARIGEPELCALLRIREARLADAASALDFFNTNETSARLLLDAFPVDTERDRPHILVGELDALGAWVVYHAARDWYEHRADNTTPLVVTVVDHHADQRVESLVGNYPALDKVCEFIPLPASVSRIHRLQAHHADLAAPPLTRAYVSAYDDGHAVQMALQLRHELDAAVPLVVALARADGITRLLDVAGSAEGLNIDVFPSLEKTCTVELIRGGSYEAIAHAIHRRWRAEQPSGKPAPAWSELPESLKESNRAHARHTAVKLRSVGCDIAPLRDWDAPEFTFSDDEVEKLGIAEHDRWCAERIADGWTLDKTLKEADYEHKKTPYLVPLADLPDKIAEYDRIFVREIPTMLASVGLQVIRKQKAK
ncbi:MAG TPA: NAD-binding protein [Mycobacterium sp.]|nr:NAD-binding protein [Mycobacterium sp.]HUH70364.1 NAD-binding protein [Mycobacterium sp.]